MRGGGAWLVVRPGSRYLDLNRDSAETNSPRRALCVGLMISPKLDLNRLCLERGRNTRRKYARKLREEIL